MAVGSIGFGVMADLSALEASSFPLIFCAFLGSEFLQLYEIYLHGIRVSRGPGSGRRLRSKTIVMSSPLGFIDTKFVTMEGLGSLDPFFQSIQWGGNG